MLDGISEHDYLTDMALLPIIVAPDRRLKVRSEPVDRVNQDLRKLMENMVETMLAASGIGLSAIQVGIAKRVVVARAPEETHSEVSGADNSRTLYLVNPQITWFSEEVEVCEEGCLSLPQQYADLERPAKVRVRYLDRDGKLQEESVSGTLARCLQHELDHLDGVLLVDHLSRVRREMVLRKLVKAKKLKQSDAA